MKCIKAFKTKSNKRFSFTNGIVVTWNQLPNEVINAKNLITFEKVVDKFWAGYAFKYGAKVYLPCHARKHS